MQHSFPLASRTAVALAAIGLPLSALQTAEHAPHQARIDWTRVPMAEFYASQAPGGPGGDFDWLIPDGTTVVFDTAGQIIVGGPNFQPTTTLFIEDGLIEVDDLRIGVGAALVFVGPNPVRVFATGSVQIDGVIHLDGNSSIGVTTLNTTNLPELGAAGNAGGGAGGIGSPNTNDHSDRGGTGWGPFNSPLAGGEGGETGWSTNGGSNGIHRRGAGGGGGLFAAAQLSANGFADESWIGLNAEPGFDGASSLDPLTGAVIGAFGAENPALFETPPDGGATGTTPFEDGDPTNDFFGRRRDPVTGGIVVGELAGPWAGSGGGGGGDASNVAPGGIYPDPFTPFGDEKGGAGGGGGGHLSLLALGPVVFGPGGQISARGGHGGGGENTSFVNRIGAAGGGGSGGHVILQSGVALDFTDLAPSSFALVATGGQGGAGANDAGGAGSLGETVPALDACHATTPPFDSNCPVGEVVGAGGDGGPGVLQLHVPGGSSAILLPFGRTLDEIAAPAPISGLVPFRFPGAGGPAGR